MDQCQCEREPLNIFLDLGQLKNSSRHPIKRLRDFFLNVTNVTYTYVRCNLSPLRNAFEKSCQTSLGIEATFQGIHSK